ncbi:ornithine carbamoyltransferase [Buchnera aphidicola]|uniref:Ornithine carbamoyltransferase n=1 Tax=Buchnera aphidicola (Sarucallis kahawaluokalani) TaxID=1241878 RepID=A0A4D6YK18_9GAMM|nr:ornithine carbamoyltransferase [Buchnera aphidicola]QCI26038.1 ornithine carbamoyltransferase [Buchnera aphidicola (Sarucallis kahawaluokalani)]
MNSLYKKSLLKITDFTKDEIKKIISLSKILKKNRKNKKEVKYLKNKNIALIFEQESTRTRCAFEIAAYEQGANISYLTSHNIHLGYKESIIDTIKVLERLYDGIGYRGISHQTIKVLSHNSNVPIWNGLTKKYHPTQLLADLLTIEEYIPNKKISEIKLAYVGDASNNIANTLLELSFLIGFTLHIVAPKKYWPKLNIMQKIYQTNKKKFLCTEDIKMGVQNVDFIYTDVWVSMGEEKSEWDKKISLLKKYQVNQKMLSYTKNDDIKVLHCLPAIHDKNTKIGKKISKLYNLHEGIEITNDIFNANSEIIFDQSENKLHTLKALMVATLKKDIFKI